MTLLLTLLGCAPGLDADFPSRLALRGSCGWELRAWSEDGATRLRARMDPDQWARTEPFTLSETTSTYPRMAWTDREGDLEVQVGEGLTGCDEGEVSLRFLPFEGLAIHSVAPDYYDEDDEGCTVARGAVGIGLEGLVLVEATGAADGVAVGNFGVSAEVEVMEGCTF